MQVNVKLLAPYTRIARTGQVQVEMEGDNMADLLGHLVRQIPALGDHLKGEEFPGALPFFLMLNGKIVKGGRPAEIRINPGDCVTITQIVAGG